MERKLCPRCEQTKTLDNFHIDRKRKDGLSCYCKDCKREIRRKYYLEHRNEILKKTMRWERENPDKRRVIRRRYEQNIRIRVLTQIAGSDNPKCVNCGCDDMRFLEVNHIDGGGHAEQRKYKTKTFYRRILDGSRKTDDLNILCRVCNALYYLETRYGKPPMEVTWKGNKIRR